MKFEEKMEKVTENINAGHSIQEVCQLFEVGRMSWYRRQNVVSADFGGKRDRLKDRGAIFLTSGGVSVDPKTVLSQIQVLIRKHPFWGYRRVHAYLKHRLGFKINKKRVYRTMQESGLLVSSKRYKPEREFRKKPKATQPNQFWGTDMTKFWIRNSGWASLVLVEDWYPKKILGWEAAMRGDTTLWLTALDQAVKEAFPEAGSRGEGVKLISDNGSQPSSRRYMAECKTLGIEQIFITYDNPKGNADTERVIRTIKEEAIWPYEFESLEEAKAKIAEVIRFYNERYCHSALNYQSPNEFLTNYFKQQEEAKPVLSEVEGLAA